jgi:hypothetical protein
MLARFMTLFVLSGIMVASANAEETALTVYNNDLAVVTQKDSMQFKKGLQTITITGVAERIDPTTVRLKSADGIVTVLEQNYRYDLATSQNVLEKYIDKNITLWVTDINPFQGVLRSVAGDVVVSTSDGLKIVKLDAIHGFDLPELPAGLVTRPTLVWNISSEREGVVATELSYMTGGFDWHAEYTAVIADDEKAMELSSWVSIQNQSGASFTNTTLKLVAGDVNRALPQPVPRAYIAKTDMMQENAAAGFQERGLFEYHLYELSGRTTVQNKEIKQIALFEPVTAKVEKRLVYDYTKDPDNVLAMIEFTNNERSGLGMPLPSGTVRVFTRDTDGTIQFVGEDTIDHTPKDDEIRLQLGSSFDITAERRVMDSRRISDRIREETLEIDLRNRKDEQVSVTIMERLWGSWDIVKASDGIKKKDATTAECTVTVPAGGVKTISYTVRYQ